MLNLEDMYGNIIYMIKLKVFLPVFFFNVYLLNEAEYDMKNYAYHGRCSASVTLLDPHSSQYTKAEFSSYL